MKFYFLYKRKLNYTVFICLKRVCYPDDAIANDQD
jgi:hypothetical protein